MLFHIRPRIFTKHNVSLVDLVIEPFGVSLRGGVDLAVGRPYPNKIYSVAYRKRGRRALDGIILDAPQGTMEFSTMVRWAVEAETIVTHRVDYKVLDEEFDLASEDMVLWYACCEELGGWSARFPANSLGEHVPVKCEPLMRTELFDGAPRDCDVTEKRNDSGLVVFLHQFFEMPTIERGRLWGEIKWAENSRAPALESAFQLHLG